MKIQVDEAEVILIRSCVVPDTTGDGNGGTDHVAQNEKPLDTGTFRQNAPESEATQSSCMEIIQWTVEEQGFSRDIANKIFVDRPIKSIVANGSSLWNDHTVEETRQTLIQLNE